MATPGRIPVTAPYTTPRHSAAKAQKIKAINERNAEICREIMELEEVQKNIKTVMTKLEGEKKVLRRAEVIAKEAMAMPEKEYQKMINAIRESAKASIAAPPIIDDEDFSWMERTPEEELFARHQKHLY